MKDAFLLIFTAAGFALIAWAFWHFFGKDSFGILATLALVIVLVDNIRLRRKLKAEQRR